MALTGPPNGTNVNGGATINLSAVAADADGTVASVRFIANGNVIGTATALPYGVSWVPSAAGTYTVTAADQDPATCGVCIRAIGDKGAAGVQEFFARSGTVVVAAVGVPVDAKWRARMP